MLDSSLDLTSSQNESIAGLATTRLRAAGGLPNESRRYDAYNATTRKRSTVMGDVSTSAPPIVRRASTWNSKPNHSRRESMATTSAGNGGSMRRERSTTTAKAVPFRRESTAPLRRETAAARRQSNYPSREVDHSASSVRYKSGPSNVVEEIVLLDFPGTETIEDFSVRIVQEQHIRFQSKRQLLKLMLDEADIDTDMLLSQDLRMRVTKPEGDDGEESYREMPPPPPSPHPLGADAAGLHSRRLMANLDASMPVPPKFVMKKGKHKNRRERKKSRSLVPELEPEQEVGVELTRGGDPNIPKWVAVDLAQFKERSDLTASLENKGSSLSGESSDSSSSNGSKRLANKRVAEGLDEESSKSSSSSSSSSGGSKSSSSSSSSSYN